MTRSLATGSLSIRLGGAALSAVLCFLGFVGFGYSPLAFVGWIPVLLVARNLSARQTYFLGLVFGTLANLGGFYWVQHLLHEFAGAGWFAATLGLLLLCSYQGSILALVLYLVRRAEVDLGLAPVWVLPLAYPALEFAYPQIFPSNYGASLYQLPILTQIAEVFGVLSLTGLVALVNGGLYEVAVARLERRGIVRKRLIVPIVVVGVVALYGAIRIPMVDRAASERPRLKVALVQTNIGGRDRDRHEAPIHSAHLGMSREIVRAHPDLDVVVWPESAYDHSISRKTRHLPPDVTEGLGVPVIFGGLSYGRGPDGERELFNTAVLTSSTGVIRSMFDKTVLLAFGETLPIVDRFPALLRRVKAWFPRTSTFNRGTTFQHFDVAGAKLMPMICYEDIIPSFVREFWRRAGAADVLVNITNDSWYGDSHEPLIHLVLASFRTIETRRPLVRSTNTGISALVDPVGRITARTTQWTKAGLVGTVPIMRDMATTPYQIIGDAFGWVALGLVALGWWRSARHRARRRLEPQANERLREEPSRGPVRGSVQGPSRGPGGERRRRGKK